MALTSVLVALTLSAAVPAASPPPVHTTPVPPIAAAVARSGADIAAADPAERWRRDTPQKRPAALPALYAAFGALQALDAYSTHRATDAGAHEANPLMRHAAGNSATMMTVKALSTAGTIYFTERAWKKNRKGAVILMAAINAATAAISARNFRNAR